MTKETLLDILNNSKTIPIEEFYAYYTTHFDRASNKDLFLNSEDFSMVFPKWVNADITRKLVKEWMMEYSIITVQSRTGEVLGFY